MTVFASPDDLAAILQRELTDAEETAALVLLEIATAEIQAELGQQITETVHTASIPGTWSRDLELPQRPVTAVTGVALDGVALASDGWAWNGRQTLRRGTSLVAGEADLDDGDLDDMGSTGIAGWHWGGPGATVAVTYTAGYVNVPADLKGLCLQVAMRTMSNPTGIRSEQLGAYQVTYTVPGTGQVFGALLTDTERATLRRRYGRTAGTLTAGAA